MAFMIWITVEMTKNINLQEIKNLLFQSLPMSTCNWQSHDVVMWPRKNEACHLAHKFQTFPKETTTRCCHFFDCHYIHVYLGINFICRLKALYFWVVCSYFTTCPDKGKIWFLSQNPIWWTKFQFAFCQAKGLMGKNV